ncbi:MAG: hypothetical protein QOF43_1064, partial [Gaiellaceae bacterium]|nr:hypothetical protein [Gaiellaceae bacterium]
MLNPKRIAGLLVVSAGAFAIVLVAGV